MKVGVDSPRGTGGRYAQKGTDSSQVGRGRSGNDPELPVLHLEKWTVHTLLADRPRGKDHPHSPRGPSGKLLATKSTKQNGSK
jgi:hypothetical protein